MFRRRTGFANGKGGAGLRLGLLVFALCATAPRPVPGQSMPRLHAPAQHVPGRAATSVGAPDPSVIQVQREQQNTAAPEKALHHQIESMPTSTDELEVIERRSQLIVTRAKVVRAAIADASIIELVEYSPNELGVIGVGLGSTTLTLWFENSREPLIYLVRVIRDPNIEYQKRVDYGKLEQKLAVLFPNSKVYLIPLSYKVVVKGFARDAEEAANILQLVRGEVINQEGSLGGPQPDVPAGVNNAINPFDLESGYIINMLRIPGEYQVMLRVRIAELNRSHLRRMGVDITALINDGRHVLSTVAGGIPSTITGLFENGEISVLVDWLASNGTAKILDEPNLTVLSGRTASFLSGGDFAVPTVVGVGGAQGATTTFRGFGTSLIVTPTVADKDLIRMTIFSEFSQLNQGNAVNGIPGTDARRVNTTVELREGQTLVLAGLISHRANTEQTRIPHLGDIPYVGPMLFSARRSTQDENELLILVTPEIVRPMDANEVPPVPGFEVTVPSDVEFYKHGMTEGSLPDTGYYQLPPYGSGSIGTDVGYQHFNPAPADPQYGPVPTAPYGAGGAPPVPNHPGYQPQQSGNRPDQLRPETANPPELSPPPAPPAYPPDARNWSPPARQSVPTHGGGGWFQTDPGAQTAPAGFRGSPAAARIQQVGWSR